MIEVQIRWPINPFRGDRFAEGWLPAAEAVLDYGATKWSFTRNIDGRLDFVQTAPVPVEGALRALLVLRGDREQADRALGLLPGAAPADVLGGRRRRPGGRAGGRRRA